MFKSSRIPFENIAPISSRVNPVRILNRKAECTVSRTPFLSPKPELIDGAVLYIRIYFLGMPALAVYNFGNAVFSAAGDTKRPLKYLSMAGVVNIILNLFFVIVCKMDVAGVAVSSIISQSCFCSDAAPIDAVQKYPRF